MHRPSVPPGTTDDRTTERRLIPSVPHPPVSVAAESTRDAAQEDFLFHLYRGSELLQENRVLEAKEELEHALTVQPLDPKGQDLLGAVYFRLGLYPRAIQIYESLEAQFPRDASIKVNLALAYLKTGQADAARRALQDAVRLHPEHKRAWGYLGLALQKLGDTEAAQIAFERGGHVMMAKRLTEKRGASVPPPPPASVAIDEGVRSVAAEAFSELDAGELRFALAEPAPSRPADGPWHTLELGGERRSPQPRTVPPASVHEVVTVPPPSQLVPASRAMSAAVPPAPPTLTGFPAPAPILAPAPAPAPAPAAVPSPDVPALFTLPPDRPLALHASGALLVRTTEEQAFAARLDALRVVAGPANTRVLHRRTRDGDIGEVLGGLGSPLVRVAGAALIALGTRPGYSLAVLTIGDELAFVREELLFGFELRLAYENGRLALDPGDGARPAGEGAPLVQLRGSGALVVELTGTLAWIPCAPGRPLTVRREWVVGWLGRLVPRSVPPGEAPSGQRGLLGFSGEGTVLVCAS